MDVTSIPSTLKFTQTHEWARLESDGTLTVGITAHAQHLLGDIVYIELPAIDKTVTKGSEIAVIESVKAASDIYGPVSGKIIAVNSSLADHPENINESPYESGWIFKMMPDNADELQQLFNANDYLKHINTAE